MSKHREQELLSAYIDNELDENERAGLEKHIPQCKSCGDELNILRRVERALSSAPEKTMPLALMAKLEDRYASRRSWLAKFRALIAPPQVWIPVSSLAAVILSIFLFVGRDTVQEEPIPLETLLAAHTRYAAESLAPKGNLVNSEFFTHLTANHADE